MGRASNRPNRAADQLTEVLDRESPQLCEALRVAGLAGASAVAVAAGAVAAAGGAAVAAGGVAATGAGAVVAGGADRLLSSGAAALWNLDSEAVRNGSAPGNRTVCGFMWTPFIRYS
jgi:hypothetical protein